MHYIAYLIIYNGRSRSSCPVYRRQPHLQIARHLYVYSMYVPMCMYVWNMYMYIQCARLFVRVYNNNIVISALQPRLLDDDTDSSSSVQRPRWAAV